MEQLLAHLIGDYILQNHWMANSKTSNSWAALLHVLLYGLPFLLLVSNVYQWFIIIGTHFIIDRWRLASYWIDFWGTGKEGWFTAAIMRTRGFEKSGGIGWKRHVVGVTYEQRSTAPDAPDWLGVWLLIIVDNTMHLTINWATLRWMVTS